MNHRTMNIQKKVLALYNAKEGMRVESPANFPIIGTHKANNMHPHQSVFYDRQNVLDEDDEDNGGKVQ